MNITNQTTYSDEVFENIKLHYEDYKNVVFISSRLTGVKIRSASFIGFKFENSKFINVSATNYFFEKGTFSAVTFSDSDFSGGSFEDTNFENVFFENCDFALCEFKNVSIKKASFSNCNFNCSVFENTLMPDCIFDKSSFKYIEGLDDYTFNLIKQNGADTSFSAEINFKKHMVKIYDSINIYVKLLLLSLIIIFCIKYGSFISAKLMFILQLEANPLHFIF